VDRRACCIHCVNKNFTAIVIHWFHLTHAEGTIIQQRMTGRNKLLLGFTDSQYNQSWNYMCSSKFNVEIKNKTEKITHRIILGLFDFEIIDTFFVISNLNARCHVTESYSNINNLEQLAPIRQIYE
jgi:hypothetical protein